MVTERESLPNIESSISIQREVLAERERSFADLEVNKATGRFRDDWNFSLEILRDQEAIELRITEERALLDSLKGRARVLMEPHIPSAIDYLGKLELKRSQMEQIRGHHLAGRLTDEQFAPFEDEFTRFTDIPNTNPELGSTIRLLQLYPELAEKPVPGSEKSPESVPTPEAEKLPVVIVNRGEKKTGVTGNESHYSPLQWDTLVTIINAGKEGISTKDLENAIKKMHPQSRSSMGENVWKLRAKMEEEVKKSKDHCF